MHLSLARMLAATDIASTTAAPDAGPPPSATPATNGNSSVASSFLQMLAATATPSEGVPGAIPTDAVETPGAPTPKDIPDATAKQVSAQAAPTPANPDAADLSVTPGTSKTKRFSQTAVGARTNANSRAASEMSGTISSISWQMLLGTVPAQPASPLPVETPAAAQPDDLAKGNSPEKLSVDGAALLAGKIAPPLGNVAFALRLSPADKMAGTPPAVQESAAGTGSSQINATGASFAEELGTLESKAAASDKAVLGFAAGTTVGPAITVVQQPATPAAAQPSTETPASQPAERTTTEPTVVSNEPVRSVRVQLAGDGTARVDLTLVERAGTLAVSVRSADSNLTHTLQQHLPDLSARLTNERYETELWVPRVDAPAASANSATPDKQGGNAAGSGGSGGQNSNSNPQQQQQPGDGQQGRRQPTPPGWFEELAAFGRTPRIRSEYLWVQ